MQTTPERAAWSIKDWAFAVGCSRVHVHRLIQKGVLKTRLMGTRRLILTTPQEFVECLPSDDKEVHEAAA